MDNNFLDIFSFDMIQEIFSYSFITRALIVGVLVSLCASLLGVSLVLKRYSMIGDGLSHVGFGSLSIAMALNLAPLMVAIPVVIIAAFFLLQLSQNSKIKGDAAIALISSSALAIGVIVTAITKGMNTDIYSYMFGSILAMNINDVYMSIGLSIIVLSLFILFYNKIFSVTFDENFATATGIKANRYNMLIAFLTAITIVVGMRIMGTMLISSLVIFPALTSMKVCKSFKSVIILSAIISIVSFFIGMIVSYGLELPVGATIVVLNLIFFILFSLFSTLKTKLIKN